MSSNQPRKTNKQTTSCLNIPYSNYCQLKNREKIQKAGRIFFKGNFIDRTRVNNFSGLVSKI